MNIYELAESGGVRDLDNNRLTSEDTRLAVGISRQASFRKGLQIGRGTHIHAATVGWNCQIDDEATLHDGVRLGSDVALEYGVEVGENSIISNHVRIGQAAVLQAEVIVGNGVSIPQEAQIGRGMIIPSTETIVVLGRLGLSNRMVTVHGGDNGPCYSAGCQNSDSWEEMSNRIIHATQTTVESAAHYREYLGPLEQIGDVVQSYYERQRDRVNELRELAVALANGESVDL